MGRQGSRRWAQQRGRPRSAALDQPLLGLLGADTTGRRCPNPLLLMELCACGNSFDIDKAEEAASCRKKLTSLSNQPINHTNNTDNHNHNGNETSRKRWDAERQKVDHILARTNRAHSNARRVNEEDSCPTQWASYYYNAFQGEGVFRREKRK